MFKRRERDDGELKLEKNTGVMGWKGKLRGVEQMGKYKGGAKIKSQMDTGIKR